MGGRGAIGLAAAGCSTRGSGRGRSVGRATGGGDGTRAGVGGGGGAAGTGTSGVGGRGRAAAGSAGGAGAGVASGSCGSEDTRAFSVAIVSCCAWTSRSSSSTRPRRREILYREISGATNGIASTSRPINRKSIIDQRPGNAEHGVCGTLGGSSLIVTQPPIATVNARSHDRPGNAGVCDPAQSADYVITPRPPRTPRPLKLLILGDLRALWWAWCEASNRVGSKARGRA